MLKFFLGMVTGAAAIVSVALISEHFQPDDSTNDEETAEEIVEKTSEEMEKITKTAIADMNAIMGKILGGVP